MMAEGQDDVDEWFQHVVSDTELQLIPYDLLEAKFVCNNCKGLAYIPHKTKCDHLFCTKCVRVMIARGKKCFIDNKTLRLKDIEVSQLLKNEIVTMPISCPFKAQGCSKTLNIEAAREHVSECAKTYAVIDCPFKCGRKIQIDRLSNHFETECHRPTKTCSESDHSLEHLNTLPIPQTTSQQRPSRSKTPVVNMFKTMNLSPKHALQSNLPISPRHESNKIVQFTWPIMHYFRLKQLHQTGKNQFEDSRLFHHPNLGYQFKIRVYLNGSGYGRGTHMSVFIGINRGFNKSSSFVHPHRLTVKILNQNRDSNEIQLDIKKSLEYDVGKSAFQENNDKTIFEFYGFKKFCEQKKAELFDYLKNEIIIFEIVKELI